MDPFQKERLSPLEHLDRTLVVVSFHGWTLLCFLLILFGATLFWAFFGAIPVTLSGKCLVFDPKSTHTLRSPYAGIVREIHVVGGENVKKGTPLALFENLESKEPFPVSAPVDGKILWVNLNPEQLVTQEQEVIAMQGTPILSNLKVFAMLPFSSGILVKPGMEVKCAIEGMNPEKYGLLRARVKELFPYPISSSEYFMQKIPSQALRDYLLLGNGPSLLLVAEPILDEKTLSGLQWTAHPGPPFPIPSGAVGTASIILEKVKPISYVFPLEK